MKGRTEIWKNIPGYEGLYQVSNYGRVKSLRRIIKHWRGGNSIKKERILRLHKDVYGYYTVNITANGIKRTHPIHQLIAIAFLGRCCFCL